MEKLSIAGELVNLLEKTVVRKYLPKAHFYKGVYVTSPSSIVEFDGSLDFSSLLVESPYHHDVKQSVLHFTSLESLYKILKSKILRYGAMDSLTDVSEFEYALQHLTGLRSANRMREIKNEIFSFSTVAWNQENLKSPYLWNEYADKSRGVCIRLRIDNVQNPFLTGAVVYGDEAMPFLRNIVADVDSFLKEHSNIRFKNLFPALAPLIALHKKAKYKMEVEKRYMHVPQIMSGGLKQFNLREQDGRKFIEVPLGFIDNHRGQPVLPKTSNVPRILLEEITLGYELTTVEKKEALDDILRILRGGNFLVTHLNENLDRQAMFKGMTFSV